MPAPPAVADRVRHVGARRVFQADQANQHQPFVRGAVGLRFRLHRTGEHAQAVMAEMVGAREPFGACVVVQRDLAVVGDHAGCGGEHRFRRAFDRDQEAVAPCVHRRHHLGGGVEGVLAHHAMPVQQRRPSRGPRAVRRAEARSP